MENFGCFLKWFCSTIFFPLTYFSALFLAVAFSFAVHIWFEKVFCACLFYFLMRETCWGIEIACPWYLTISHVKWLVKFLGSVAAKTFLFLYIWVIFQQDQVPGKVSWWYEEVQGTWKFVKWQFQPVESVCATVELTFHSSHEAVEWYLLVCQSA